MRRFAFLLLAAALALPAGQARAEVSQSSASAFLVTDAADTTATPAQVWRALGRIGRWWSPEHSYSHDPARHMTLDTRAGGCFCERWSGGSVRHATVLATYEDEGVRTLRLDGALGPLQALAVNGVLTFTIAPNAQGAHVTLTYRVSGDPSLGLDHMAAPVDGVTMEQMRRLIRFAETGISP